ncbi:PEP/pyruvate-binding domain-containing protein [Nocardia sp. XZ_19_385]|uniref:PEP/pyruvate-binding domain-containing protein n=1 Tax=Nocardia sp. XZ_19_385 TaxID=2769488 RepID=UPI00189099A2|nr:PEP/pyruvate-binding domain-containing protein [Nocardia sp. XZ_19_385]
MRKKTVSDLITVLGAADPRPQESLGGKGARLDELLRAGLPVPPAFCLTTELFQRFLAEVGVDVEDEPAKVRETILAAEVPADIAAAVAAAYAQLGQPRVAVRSSASKEDSAAYSFAGQHDTVLDIAGDAALLEAVKTCWASLWSDRAVAYRESAGAGTIAVVVQQMIDADTAGVLFTRDPISGRTDRFVVDACWGLGEGLVSGRVTSDSFLVDPAGPEVVEQNVRYKVIRCAPVGSGAVELVKVDEAFRNVPCLTEKQLFELAALAERIRDHYGAEQDIEWAVRDRVLYLLQARPITTGTPQTARLSPYNDTQPTPIEHGTFWTRMDIGEIFTGVMTPLGLSFAKYYQDNVHGDCIAGTGVRDRGEMPLHMGYFQGYVYLNVSYTAHILSQSLATRDQQPFDLRFASEEIDLADYRNPFGSYPLGVSWLRSTLFWFKTAAREFRDAKPRAQRMTESRHYEYDRAHRIDLRKLDRRELHDEMRRRLAYFHDMNVGYMPYFLNAFGFYGVLEGMCGAWLGAAGERVQNHFKTRMSNLRTLEAAREVWELAEVARTQPEALRIIRAGSAADVAARLRNDEAGQAFWTTHMEPFLRENGTRAHQEMELTHPRWIDDPAYVFQMIRRYTEEGFSIGNVLGAEDDPRAAEAMRAVERLPAAKRRAVKTALSLYETCSSLRETARLAMITSIWLVRDVVYEVGRRLIEAGLLRSPDEVAYLDFADIQRYLAGGDPHEIVSRTKLEEARRTFQNYARLPAPPLSIIGEWDVTKSVRPLPEGARLPGLGTSPGQAVGRARIVEDLAWQADEFQFGEILVTQYTDSSWTPLFAIAGAIVTDIGSMLSHSSIVSREFRVPAVVNTKHATRVIKTGDLLMVDGDRGVVEVIDG